MTVAAAAIVTVAVTVQLRSGRNQRSTLGRNDSDNVILLDVVVGSYIVVVIVIVSVFDGRSGAA